MLEVKNLSRSFGGLKAVHDLSFSIKKGLITGLIGPNGAGKTTVFNLITRFMPSQSGTILYQGESLLNLSPHQVVRKGIVRTFQQIRIFKNLTVRENLLLGASHQFDGWTSAFGKHDETALLEKIKSILQIIKLDHYLDQPASDLSYGQSKLIEIARTLLLEADLILLDEPASGVNPTLLGEVERLILHLKESGKTILLIEHNMPFLMRLSDEVIVMENGKFLMQDLPKIVQKDPRVLEAYLGDSLNSKTKILNTHCHPELVSGS